MKKHKINTAADRMPCTHLAGEFFVAAELSRMGFNVGLTLGNAKKVDLFVEVENKTLPIQVKALAKKQNVGWPIKLGAKFLKDLIFVLVILGKTGSSPEYFVVDGATVTRRYKSYKGRAILNIKDVSEFKDNWKLMGSIR